MLHLPTTVILLTSVSRVIRVEMPVVLTFFEPINTHPPLTRAISSVNDAAIAVEGLAVERIDSVNR